MNATLSTAPGRHDRPPQPVRAEHAVHADHPLHTERRKPARRVNLIDRIALHLGIALITWGRRSRAGESRERRARRYEQHLARLERERQAERGMRLLAPPR